MNLNPKAYSYLNDYEEKLIIIWQEPGFGAHVVSRIISASPEVFWNENDPVRYPDNVEGFVVHPSALPFMQQHLASAHYNRPLLTSELKRSEFLQIFSELKNTNKKYTLVTHDKNVFSYYKGSIVRLIGNSQNRLNISNYFDTQNEVKKLDQEKVINLDVFNLLTSDYERFIITYLDLCKSLNIFPRVNSVRSFILLWLEKQKRCQRLLS